MDPTEDMNSENKDEDDVDIDDCNLNENELLMFTQSNSQNDVGDDEDSDDDSAAPPRIDFSSQMTQSEDDNCINYYGKTQTPKRQKQSAIIQDAPGRFFLRVGNVDKMFRVGDYFPKVLQPFFQPPEPEVVFKIERLYNDAKTMKKKAQCKVFKLARNTFIGQEDEFEAIYGKYVFLRNSHSVNLCDLKLRIEDKAILHELENTQVFFDPPPKKTKGVGWEIAYGFAKNQDKIMYSNGAPTVVDLFAGGGGVSQGFIKAGFRLTHAVEHDPMAANTLELNHPGAQVFLEDVESYLQRFPAEVGSFPFEYKDSRNHIHASTPCQGFSRQNRNGGKNDTKNNECCLLWPKSVISSRADTGSFENVTGMLFSKHLHYTHAIITKFLTRGYQIRIGIINCAHFGDAQNRERIIMMVSRMTYPLPELPRQTHGTAERSVRTARDAIGDLESLEPRTEPGMMLLPGTKILARHHWHNAKKCPSKEFKLHANEPSNTILCAKEVKHYSKERNITNLERARLQGFPDDWKFCGRPTDIMKQIGNAVPIGTSTAIGKALFECYEPGCLYDDSTTASEDQPISIVQPTPAHNTRHVVGNVGIGNVVTPRCLA